MKREPRFRIPFTFHASRFTHHVSRITFQAFPGRVLGVVAAVLPAGQIGDLGKAQREGTDPLRDLQSVRDGQADFPDVAVVVAVSAVP